MVDIGIVTYNRLELTKKCITSLRKYTKMKYRLYVADNGSNDGTQNYLINLKENGIIDKLILFKKNVGIAPAVNSLWESSRSKYFLKLDNDIEILQENWLEKLFRTIEENDEIEIIAYSFLKQLYDIYFPLKNLSSGTKVQISSGNLGGGCLLISQKAKENLGYFCEDYSPYGEEDVDYSFRARQFGYILPYMKETSFVKHNYLKTNEVHDAKAYRKFKNKLRNRNTKKNGILKSNLILYQNKIRPLKMRRKFITKIEDNYQVKLKLNKKYLRKEQMILNSFLKKKQ